MKQSLMLFVNPRAGRARSAAPMFEAAALLCRDGETLLFHPARPPPGATPPVRPGKRRRL